MRSVLFLEVAEERGITNHGVEVGIRLVAFQVEGEMSGEMILGGFDEISTAAFPPVLAVACYA